jgi:hypothetical protein
MSEKDGFWSKLGGWVADKAPLLGGALGGPGGAALGGLIAATFGGDPNDPEQLLAHVQADPQAAVKLREIELKHKERFEELAVQRALGLAAEDTKRIEAVNETMRAESQSERWPQYSWRPACGFALAIGFLLLIAIVGWVAVVAVAENRPALFAAIPELVGAFLGLFGSMAAVVGVTAWHRGQQKRERAVVPRAAVVRDLLVKKLGS